MAEQDKDIKNPDYSPRQLCNLIKEKQIIKPKFQRKKKWQSMPSSNKTKVPNDREFIDFLYKNGNSVYPISLAKISNNDKQNALDGNNRINAIVNFLNKPFSLYPERLSELMDNIQKYINDSNIITQLKNLIKQINYDQLVTFKYNYYFKDQGYNDLYDKYLKIHRDELEIVFDKIIELFKIKKDRFDNKVKILFNLFINYTPSEQAETFCDLNKYPGLLSEQEALAGRLYIIIIPKINEEFKKIESDIKYFIAKYYIDQSKNEILDCHKFDNEPLNAFEFCVGYQYYANSKCNLIEKPDNDGISIFFKIIKTLYGNNYDQVFTSENVNDFIGLIDKTINILTDIEEDIYIRKLDGINNMFNTVNKKLRSLKKNNIFLILTAIIGYIRNGTDEKIIKKSITLAIYYHFIIQGFDNTNITNDEKKNRATYKTCDGILYEAGGAYIDNKAKEYLKNPNSISCDITEDIMRKVLLSLIKENIKPTEHITRTNGRDSKEKRRARKTHEKIMIFICFLKQVPISYLSKEYWIEHFHPFSCSWDGEIDIDRLGNIFPILKDINKSRGNKNISEYTNYITDKEFMKFIDYKPEQSIYDKTVNHSTPNRKPKIIDNTLYNDTCASNENKMVTTFIDYFYNSS
jgi:hypothetical protein